MPLTATPPRHLTASIANGADTSEWLDFRDALAGVYFIPGTYTNTGATNLQNFDVSNNFGDLIGTAVSDILPNVSDTVQTQRQTVSTSYPFLPDLFNFRFVRFNGTANEGGARTIHFTLQRGYVRWERKIIEIANAGTTSGALDLTGVIGASFLTPAALTGTSFTFSVSKDGEVYTTLKDTADSNIAQTVGVDSLYPFPARALGFPYVKIVSGSAEGALRSIVCDLKYRG